MGALLKLIPGGLWTAVGVAVTALVVLLGVQTVRLSNEKADHALDLREFAIERANAAQVAAAQTAAYRLEEQRRADAQKVIDDETQARLVAAQADAASAAAASQRLSERVGALVASARRAAANPAAGGERAPASDSIGVLADVLIRADTRAGILADIADRRGLAGAACERSYDALTGAH